MMVDMGPLTNPIPVLTEKPCPFCGCLLIRFKESDTVFHPGAATDSDCILSGKGVEPKHITAWNRRVGEAETYALGLLIEEMGEAMQPIGKALRFGLDTPGVKRLDGTVDMSVTPRTMIPKELGDVQAASEFADDLGVSDTRIRIEQARAKYDKLTDPKSRDNLGRRLAPEARRPR